MLHCKNCNSFWVCVCVFGEGWGRNFSTYWRKELRLLYKGWCCSILQNYSVFYWPYFSWRKCLPDPNSSPSQNLSPYTSLLHQQEHFSPPNLDELSTRNPSQGESFLYYALLLFSVALFSVLLGFLSEVYFMLFSTGMWYCKWRKPVKSVIKWLLSNDTKQILQHLLFFKVLDVSDAGNSNWIPSQPDFLKPVIYNDHPVNWKLNGRYSFY